MRPSIFRQFSIAALVTILIMSVAGVASAADDDLSFSVTAAPSGAFAVAGEDSWVLQVVVSDGDQPASLSDPSDLTITSSSQVVTISSIANLEVGLYVARISANEPGAYPISVEHLGQEIDSLSVQFFSSDPDPSQSTLFAVPEEILATCGSAVVEDPVIATATVRDDQGTGIPGLEVVFTYGAEATETRITDSNGIASVELFFDVPDSPTTETVNATINANDASVDLLPASVTIQPSEGCSGTALVLNWKLEAPTQLVGLGLRVLITALDADGQVATVDPTKLTVTVSSDDVTVGTLGRRVGGTYAVSLLSSVPGDYTVSVAYNGKTYGQPLPFSFVEPAPAPDTLPDLDQSYVFVSKWLAEPGEEVLVTAVMKDSQGKPVKDAQVRINLFGNDTYQTTCITLADGRCSVGVSLPIPAEYDLIAFFNGKQFGTGQTIFFLGDDERDYRITMEATPVSGGPVRADGYDSWETWITILNPDGTPATGVIGVGLTTIDAATDAMVYSVSNADFEKQPNGVYHTYLNSTVPGSFLVYAFFGWTWAEPVTLSFTAVPDDEPGARLLLSSVQVNEDSRELLAQALVHDDKGQPQSSVKVDFSLGSATDVLSARQCYTDKTGQCSVRVWPNVVGEHNILASIDGEPLIGSPATVRLVPRWNPGPDDQLVRLSEFTLAPLDGELVPADGVSQWVGTVTLTSDYDFPLSGLADDVEAMLTPSNPAVTIGDIIDNDDNTYTMTFTSDQPGEFTVTAYYQGVAIERELEFGETPPTPDPQQSSFAAAYALADVGTQVLLTVMVKDSAGVVMKDVDVSFTTEAPGVLSKPTCTTESDGRCTVTVTSNEVATIHASAFVDNQEISGSSLSIRFQASSPSQSSSTTSQSPTQGSTSTSPTVTSTAPTQSVTSASPPVSPTNSVSAPPTQQQTNSQSPTQGSTSASPTQGSTSARPTEGSTSMSPTSTSASPTQGSTSSSASSTSTSPAQGSTSANPTQSTTSVPPTQGSTSASPTSTSASPTQGTTSVSPPLTQPPTSTPAHNPTLATSSQSTTQPPTSVSTTSTSTPTSPTSVPATSTSVPTTPTTPPPTTPTSAPTSPTSPPPTSTSPASPTIDLNVESLRPGQTLTIGGENWFPGETVRVLMYSTEKVLGTETVKPDGTLPTLTVLIPTDLEIGLHTIKIEGSVSGSVETTFTVLTPVPTTSAPASTSPVVSTGGTTQQSLVRWVVFGLIAIGAGLILNQTRLHQRKRQAK